MLEKIKMTSGSLDIMHSTFFTVTYGINREALQVIGDWVRIIFAHEISEGGDINQQTEVGQKRGL